MHIIDIGTLRPATKKDVSAIVALTRAAYKKWIPLVGREPGPMLADYALAVRTHRFDLLEQSGELVALVETILRPDHFWIENLAISPKSQRRGLGRWMLDHAENVARSLGHTTVKLVTNKAFTGNVDFYRHAGFVIEREEDFKGGVGVHLTKAL